MKAFFLSAMAVFLIGVGFYAAAAKGVDPDADLAAYKDYFEKRFPKNEIRGLLPRDVQLQ